MLSRIIVVVMLLLLPVSASALDLSQGMVDAYDWLHEAPPPKARNWYQRILLPNEPFDNAEKILMTTYLGLQAADIATTVIAIDGGATETNPVFGSDPSTAQLVMFKAASGLVIYSLLNWTDNHAARKTMLVLADIMYTGVVLNNTRVIKGLY